MTDNKPAILADAEEAMLRLRVGSSSRVLLGVGGAGLVQVALAWQEAPLSGLVIWYLLVIVTQLARIRIEVHTCQADSGLPLARRIRLASYSALASGLVQAVSVLFFPFEGAAEQALHTLILLTLATGAVIYTAGHPRTYLPYMLPIVLALTPAWWFMTEIATERPWLAGIFGILLLFYAYNLVGYARDTWTMFINAAALRHQERQQSEKLAKAVRKAEAASQAKTRFLAAASHDLRQPIHTIALLTGVLKLRHQEGDSKEVVRLLDTVVQSLSGQLDDLLDISKLDAGVVKASVQPLSLPRFLRNRLEEVRNEASAKHIGLHLDADQPATVLTDPNLLERVLRNLLNNAVKFTERGEVRLGLSIEDGQAVIRVKDTGCGIAPERQQDVFQEFIQLNNPERDRAKGMGLGLSIVDRLCRLLDIDLRLTSQINAGSTFELRMPLQDIGGSKERPALMPSVPVRPGLRVMVVDDERTVRNATAWLLTEVGCECLLAEGLDEAVRLAARQSPDIVLADFRLRAEETGIAVILALRENQPDLPAAIISGDIGPEQLQAVEKAGLTLLHKPLRAEALLQWLSQQPIAKTPAPPTLEHPVND
ncbi:MAG: hybrid sensor histidine kinase/response regulator [Hydrogenophaga sp.]|jgi:signal transduction histidine kinase/ActR/RegA family two-component response regulator|nr:hybrid sensor histidine kinase/response regulator [Hydrogenophaga sp.]